MCSRRWLVGALPLSVKKKWAQFGMLQRKQFPVLRESGNCVCMPLEESLHDVRRILL
jgi:hypothetical protein